MLWSKKPAPPTPTPPPVPPVVQAPPPLQPSVVAPTPPLVPSAPPLVSAQPPVVGPAPMRLAQGCPGVFDRPKNPLEVALVAVRARQIGIPQFLEELFNGDVFVLPLAKDLVAGPTGELTLSKAPTLFCMKYPDYSALALYTSGERAKPTHDLHPEFRFATQVPAGDFLLGLRGGFGLVVNPYWDVNMEWNPDQVARILAMMKRE